MKEDLIEEFFSLGGAYKNLNKMDTFEKKLKRSIKELEQEDLQLYEVLTLLKILKSEFENINFEQVRSMAYPILNRLQNKSADKWSLFDTRISVLMVIYTPTFEEAEKFSRKVLLVLNKFKADKRYTKLKLYLYSNMLIRAMKAKFFEINETAENKERLENLAELFEECSDEILEICELEEDELFKIFESMTNVRVALFNEKYKKLDELIDRVEKTGGKALYKYMKSAIYSYLSNAGTKITKELFAIMCGKNVRKMREKLDITIDELAILLGCSKAQITLLETGERPFYSHQLFIIAQRFGITMDELACGENYTKKAKV